MLIKLTNDNGASYQLNAELIERVVPSRNGSEIQLTTGRWATCRETHSEVSEIVRKSNEITMSEAAFESEILAVINKHLRKDQI